MSDTMREILADLVAEQQGLDQSLQRAPDRDWKKRLVSGGPTVQETIGRLAWGEQHAARLLLGEAGVIEEIEAYPSAEAFHRAGMEQAKAKRPQEVIEWWRFARADVVDALSRQKASARVPWFGGDISARTFATIRLAETWAQGLGILSALDKDIVDHPRLVHVAWLGWATLPSAFALEGEAYPEPIRLELVGPSYARWIFGPEGSENVIRGQGGDWCRLAVGHTTKTGSLTAQGEIAERTLSVVGIFP
jgi:uncharacterized protein (TIGR03084 family)